MAKNLLHGTYEKQYSLLRHYISELKGSNPNTTAELLTSKIQGANNVLVHK